MSEVNTATLPDTMPGSSFIPSQLIARTIKSFGLHIAYPEASKLARLRFAAELATPRSQRVYMPRRK